MDSDRTRWSDPVRAHMAVQQLEEKLSISIDPAATDGDLEDVDSAADVVETPD